MDLVDVRKTVTHTKASSAITESIKALQIEPISEQLIEILTAIRDQDLLEGRVSRVEIAGDLESSKPMLGLLSQHLRLNVNPWTLPKLVAYKEDWNSDPKHWDGMLFDTDREPGWYCIKIKDLRP